MGTIELHGMRFFAHHGYYETERRMGQEFVVDILARLSFGEAEDTSILNHTVNYEKIYQKVKQVMSHPHRLLESLLNQMGRELLEDFDEFQSVEVAISKNPQLGGHVQKVCLRKTFHKILAFDQHPSTSIQR